MSGLIDDPETIWLVIEPMDLRRGIDGLSHWLQQTLAVSPCAGSAYIFRNRTGLRIKVLLWDGTGVWLCSRRLHQSHFVWPRSNESCWTITSNEWQWLIKGVDWQRLRAVPLTHCQA
jgi:transposase